MTSLIVCVCVCVCVRVCRSSKMSYKLSLVDLLTNPVRHIFLLGVKWNAVSTVVNSLK